MSSNLFEIKNLSVCYPSSPTPSVVSEHVRVQEQQLTFILGHNGVGKSTFVKSLVGKLPLQGELTFQGEPTQIESLRWLRSLSYIEQESQVNWLFPLSVREFAAQGLLISRPWWKRFTKQDWQAVDHKLELVGLQEQRKTLIEQLSGGQKRKLLVARALLQEATLFLLDEPFVGIDAHSEKELWRLLRLLIEQEGKTVVMVHHDLLDVQEQADSVLFFSKPTILKPAQVRHYHYEPGLLETLGLIRTEVRNG